MIKKLIEKLYFKCYPDRKDAYLHSLEPIECRVVNYPTKTLHAQILTEACFEEQITSDIIRDALARNISKEIMQYATIENDKYSHPGKIAHRVTVTIVDRRV